MPVARRSPTRRPRLLIDTTAPLTTDNAPAGWQHGSCTLTLTAADDGSGFAGTTYSVDGGHAKAGTQVIVSGDGVHQVAYQSSDHAGNVGAARSCLVRIDDTPPVVVCPQAGLWVKSKSLTVNFAANDPLLRSPAPSTDSARAPG